VYTGAIGYMGPGSVAEFNVAIRTISLREGEARMGIGSGIVFDSQPALEFAECQTKVSFLTCRPSRDFQLIETLRLEDESYTLLDEHLERLTQSAEYFDMAVDHRLKDALESAARMAGGRGPVRVRLLLDRNGGVTWTATPIAGVESRPVNLLLARRKTDPSDVFLRHKTTCRALYDDSFRDAQARGYADALFCNLRGELTEGAVHNVIVSLHGSWITPPSSSGVLPGVYRRALLKTGRVSEQVIKLDDLLRAQAVYICNSVRGMRSVSSIEQESHLVNAMETLWEAAIPDQEAAPSFLTFDR